MKSFRYAGYFLAGTVWLFFGWVPVFPFGVFALAGALKDARRALAIGLVLLGMVAGFFGFGIYLLVNPEGKMTSYSIAPSVSFNLHAVQKYRANLKYAISGALHGGRIVADASLECLEKNDARCMENLFDENFLNVKKQDLTDEVNNLLTQAGKIKLKGLADIQYRPVPEKKGNVFLFVYVVSTEKTPDFAIVLGVFKKDGQWRLVSLSVAPAKPS